ncbi:MAG: hypothetical protein JO083_01125 [Candidatus Eremiobacteraeota bacterium]|nr:hypothetical protein [Candidatus Eremiobacteraeota bacterium]MBV8370005.1 hypothetical protein [Candidatus Eremiobacteraeota bacterium]
MHDDSIIAVVAVMFVFGAPVVAFIVARALRHQERIEMIRRGIVPPDFTDRRAYRAWRKAGSPWPPPGAQQAGPQPGQAPWVQPPPAAPWTPPEDDPQRALFKGIRIALIGFALTIGLGALFGGFSGNPAVLGGLIPMFVGIAQIIIALISGAQLPWIAPQVTFIPPPPHQPGAPPPPPPPPGYGSQPPPAQPPPWAERPRFEELSKPTPPPDVR